MGEYRGIHNEGLGALSLAPIASIITVYYNTPAELIRLGATMRKVLPQNLYEWIIVDNHSGKNLSSELPDATYFTMDENLGFGKACNRGAEVAVGRFFFFVNPDCEIIGDCLTPLVAAAGTGCIAGPLVYNSDGTIQLSFGPFLSLVAEFVQKCRMRLEKTGFLQSWLRRKTNQCFHPDYVSGCAFMIRADVFRELGGFDEAFFLYHEDADLCRQARNRDWPTKFIPDARILHHRNRSRRNEQTLADVEYRKSQLYYYSKNLGRLQRSLLKAYLSWKFRTNPTMRESIRQDQD